MKGQGYRLTGSAIDRAGGARRLAAIAADLVGRRYDVVADETDSAYRLVVVDPATGEVLATLEEVPVAASTAVRSDQSMKIVEDRAELEEVLAAEVRRLSGRRRRTHA